MIKKTRKIIVALFLFFSVFGGLMLSSPINAADQACTGVDTELENKQIKCNILDSASLKFYDSGDIEIPTDPDNPIVPTGSTFKANVSFSLNDNLRQIMANAEDSNGFYYEFDMEPSTIDVGSLNNLPLIMIGGGENGEDITFAHVSITDGKVRITFTAAIADLDSISGNFTINCDLILDESSTSNEIDIKIPAQQELNVTVKIQDAIEDVISKTGSIITNSDNLPTGIEWTIDINENSETLSNVKVTDTIPAGLTFTEVKVYDDSDDQLDASAYNVNVSSATPPVVTIDFLGDANHQINAPYKIVIKTSIDDYDDIQKESMNLTNTATLYSDETDNEEVYADVNVPFGKTIGKEASKFDRANGIISWESFFNGRGVTMPAGTVITDTYDSNLDFVTSSFTMTDEYDVAFTDYVLTQDASNHKFTITFPNGLDKKVILNYDTKIKAGLVIAGDGQEFTNDFTFGTTTVTGKHWVGQGNGVKKQTGIDYEKREIDYSIEVNKDKYQMKNLIITDSFDFKGLELIDGKDPVVTYKGTDLDPGTDYTFVKTDNNGGFKITLLGNYADPGIDDVLTINFTAKYDPEAIDDGGNTPNIPNSDPVKQYPANSVLRNTATVDFKVGDADYQSKSTVDTPLDSTITNNGLKTGSYD